MLQVLAFPSWRPRLAQARWLQLHHLWCGTLRPPPVSWLWSARSLSCKGSVKHTTCPEVWFFFLIIPLFFLDNRERSEKDSLETTCQSGFRPMLGHTVWHWSAFQKTSKWPNGPFMTPAVIDSDIFHHCLPYSSSRLLCFSVQLLKQLSNRLAADLAAPRQCWMQIVSLPSHPAVEVTPLPSMPGHQTTPCVPLPGTASWRWPFPTLLCDCRSAGRDTCPWQEWEPHRVAALGCAPHPTPNWPPAVSLHSVSSAGRLGQGEIKY